MNSVKPHKEANRLTALWRQFGPGTYPIDLNLVVEELINPTLEREELKLVYESFDSFDGLMKRATEEVWVAVVNERIRYVGRKNFTAAHEVFHFLGHRKLISDFQCTRQNINDFEIEAMEVEANEFASQLLLPPDLIRQPALGAFTYETVKGLSDDLGASVSAVAYKWLKLCPSSYKLGFFISRDGFISQGYASPGAYSSGLFFKSGMELPTSSATTRVQAGDRPASYEFDVGVWNKDLGGEEDVHRTHFEDYTYTFITLKS